MKNSDVVLSCASLRWCQGRESNPLSQTSPPVRSSAPLRPSLAGSGWTSRPSRAICCVFCVSDGLHHPLDPEPAPTGTGHRRARESVKNDKLGILPCAAHHCACIIDLALLVSYLLLRPPSAASRPRSRALPARMLHHHRSQTSVVA